MAAAREPEEIYRETRREGRRRLSRPLLELSATALTWFVEGASDSLGVRITMAWMVGALIVLGTFNHAVVSTLELVFGMRYGADVDASQLLSNLGLAVVGNLAGGLLFVTFARTVQAAERSE